jgi:ADP-ribose pyrophosphatase
MIGSCPGPDYRVVRVREDIYRSPQGVDSQFVVFEAPDWVNVLALTSESKVVMVRQFRHGIQEETWEFPGGMVDPGETPLQAAQRELLEESGYASEQWQELGSVYANPALQNNRCWIFLASQARQVQEPHLDPMEDISLATWDQAELDEAVRDGRIGHALIAGAYLRFRAYHQKD